MLSPRVCPRMTFRRSNPIVRSSSRRRKRSCLRARLRCGNENSLRRSTARTGCWRTYPVSTAEAMGWRVSTRTFIVRVYRIDRIAYHRYSTGDHFSPGIRIEGNFRSGTSLQESQILLEYFALNPYRILNLRSCRAAAGRPATWKILPVRSRYRESLHSGEP